MKKERVHVSIPFNLADPIPCFPLPLQAGDDEPIVDLNQLLQQIYREASYHLRLDYTKPPLPLLQEDEQQWAAQRLQAAKLI